MTNGLIELSIDVPTQTKLAIERAAAERSMSVPEFLQEVDTGYLEEEATH
jgi:hypothetical protein